MGSASVYYLHKVPPDVVLEQAIGELDDVILIGTDKNGGNYYASSMAGKPELLYYAQLFINKLMWGDFDEGAE